MRDARGRRPRASEAPGWGGYSVDEAAERHGASVEHETTDARRRTRASRSASPAVTGRLVVGLADRRVALLAVARVTASSLHPRGEFMLKHTRWLLLAALVLTALGAASIARTAVGADTSELRNAVTSEGSWPRDRFRDRRINDGTDRHSGDESADSRRTARGPVTTSTGVEYVGPSRIRRASSRSPPLSSPRLCNSSVPLPSPPWMQPSSTTTLDSCRRYRVGDDVRRGGRDLECVHLHQSVLFGAPEEEAHAARSTTSTRCRRAS